MEDNDYTKAVLIVPGARATRFNGTLLQLINAYRLTLPTLAAHTPFKGVSLKVIDESVDPLTISTSADIVGISAMTPTALKAYQIADVYRKLEKKVVVVLGGIHPTVLPEEALQHADVVVQGPGGLAWQQILKDFKNGELKQIYDGHSMPRSNVSLEREIVESKSVYSIATVQTSEGCPNNCNFCSVKLMHPGFHRYKLDEIIEDITSIKGKYISFVDDNLWGNKKFAKALFKEMAGLGKQWISQAPISIAQDEELLRLAAEAGCVGVYIGIDSVIEESLKAANKRKLDVRKISEYIRRIQDHGISVEAGVIFGFDNEDTSVFERTIEFYDNTTVNSLNLHILTPYPGTQLMETLEGEGRILHHNWNYYDTQHVVFKPTKMTAGELQEGYEWAWKQTFSWGRIGKRILQSDHPLYSAIFQVAGRFDRRSMFESDNFVSRFLSRFVDKRLANSQPTRRANNNSELYFNNMFEPGGCGKAGSWFKEEHYQDASLTDHL